VLVLAGAAGLAPPLGVGVEPEGALPGAEPPAGVVAVGVTEVEVGVAVLEEVVVLEVEVTALALAPAGTVRVGAPAVSLAEELPPQAVSPRDSRIPATSAVRSVGVRLIFAWRPRADPYACRNAGSR
jgi:hypothetical protein